MEDRFPDFALSTNPGKGCFLRNINALTLDWVPLEDQGTVNRSSLGGLKRPVP